MLFKAETNNNQKGPHTSPNSSISKVIQSYPTPVEPRIADNLPKNVEAPLLEAERAFYCKLFSAAGSCYRKALERAVKHIYPEGKGLLNKRIREIEKNGLLPPQMIELMDKVRLFGNATMHEDENDPTEDECEGAREFCHLFFTYTFSLPKMISKASESISETKAK